MPLLIGSTLTPAPPGEGLGSVLPMPPLAGFGSLWAVWTDPHGQEWQLSDPNLDQGWFTTNALNGAFGANPIEIVVDPLSRGGDQVRYIRSQSRRLTWPLHIWGDDHEQFVTRWRNLMHAFTATTHLGTAGILTVYRYDAGGTVYDGRQIDCFYEDGFTGDAGQGQSYANPVLTLFCPDGYWRDVQPVELSLSYRQGAPYLRPYPTVSPSGISGQFSLPNRGDADAWPVWEITGPMTSLTVTNTTLAGAAFTLNHQLAEGETATVDLSKPNRPLLRSGYGENLTGKLDWPGAQLWPMRCGDNRVDIQMTGASVGSFIKLSFYPRYEGA